MAGTPPCVVPLFLLTCAPLLATATRPDASPGLVLYVSPDGSDSASGRSPATPLATATTAARLVADAARQGLPPGGAEVRTLPSRRGGGVALHWTFPFLAFRVLIMAC